MVKRRSKNYFSPDEKPCLVAEVPRRVQFDEVDALSMVWHGRYASFFEQGRNEWGRKFGFSYDDMYRNGFVMPIVQLHIDYFRILRYDEQILIKTFCHWTEAAKMNLSYEIFAEDGTLAARGYTVQVYTDLQGTPLCLLPEFAENWLKKWDQWSK